MIRNFRWAVSFFVIVFAAACEKTVYITAPDPEVPGYIVVVDTTTTNLPNNLGGIYQVGFAAVITGNVEVPSERFVVAVDKPSLVKLTSVTWERIEGYSPEAQARTITFVEALQIKGIAKGTARITVWHPSAPNLKKLFIMKIEE